MSIAAKSESFELRPYKSLDNASLQARIAAVRASMGSQLLILGHHYQQDEVIAMSDLRGDSYQLSKMAAESGDCRAIAFCGVHFMAETADILANQPKKLADRGGERVTVLWTMSPGGGTASVDALGSQALRVGKWGDAETIQAAGGKFAVGLAPATANSNAGDRNDYVVGGDPVILVERTDGNMHTAFRSLDDVPVAGPVVEAASVADPQPRSTGSSSAKKATPTPTPQKATPTPTPRRR